MAPKPTCWIPAPLDSIWVGPDGVAETVPEATGLHGGSWVWGSSSWDLWGGGWNLRGGSWVGGDWDNGGRADGDGDSAWGGNWVSGAASDDGGWDRAVGGGCANGDGRGCSWVGVGGRAWAVSDGQGNGLGDCVGVVSLNDSCW